MRLARQAAPALGVSIVELASGESVYGYEADTQRILASNTKLFTTAAALDRLGPGYFFETDLLVRGEVRDGVLEGDLAVVGGGDPNLSGRHFDGDSLAIFRRWGRQLRALGIEAVAGDLVLVHGFFAGPLVHPDWPRDQLDTWYEAPVDALSFNDNCVLVRVSGGQPGRSARVELLPRVPVLEVRNHATTAQDRKRGGVAIHRSDGSQEIRVSGSITGAQPVEAWITVPDPVRYFGEALRTGLAEAGVRADGELRPSEHLPGEGWRQVAVHRTDLVTTLQVINKRSQNFYAESLLKVLGARLCGEGSWPAGVRAVGEFLAELGIRGYQMSDGSGMSRNNRFTPRQVVTLLAHMWTHPRGPEFVASLPYSGEEDLRWEKRLAEAPYRGNVFAKTGGLNAVSTLSGYAKARSGRVYAFSILCNQTRSNWDAQRAQDGIVRALIDNG